jgi:hypothetical protein
MEMQGRGNDFAAFDERASVAELGPALIKEVAVRHRGIGFDQPIGVRPGTEADAFMRICDAAGACGKAMRGGHIDAGDGTGYHWRPDAHVTMSETAINMYAGETLLP